MIPEAASGPTRACVHLVESDGADYAHRFTGQDLEYDLVCQQCQRNPAEIDANLRVVDSEAIEKIIEEGCWDGIVGEPEIRRRASDLRFAHELVEIPQLQSLHVLDIQPIPATPGTWMGLSADGAIFRLDLERHAAEELFRLPESLVDLHEEAMLRVSRAGDFILIANTKGRHGIVVQVQSGQATLQLDRGDYHIEHCRYSAEFFEWEGQTVVIHATDWNRLDVSDALSGKTLTDRTPTSYQQGQPRPEHYLDYFHCGLTVSPDQQLAADTGWVWSPTGLIAVWSLPRWLQGNVWESEDGSSKRYLCQRDYYWDGPVCWLSDQHLAVWGYGGDDEWLIPAICIQNIETGEQERWFAGPKGTIAFDEYFFSWDADGLEVWDAATGERLAGDESLNPVGYDRGSKLFLTLHDGSVRISRLERRKASTLESVQP